MIEPLGDAKIDREKIRKHLRFLDGTALRVWLNRAIRLLPDEAFPELIEDYAWLSDVTSADPILRDLREQTRSFYEASMAGAFYQEFNVSSHNCTQFSLGTERFAAEHARLIEECLRAERSGDHEVAGECFSVLIDILREIDRFERDIVFFADEAGSWQFNVLWKEVLPAWFRALSKTLDAHSWAEIVLDAIDEFGTTDTEEIMQTAYGSSSCADHLGALFEVKKERLLGE